MANRIRLQPPADIPKESEHGRFLRQLCEYINRERHGELTTADYSIFEDNGFLEFNGQAQAWDDMQFQISNGRVGAANFPAWQAFTTNTSEFGFDVDEYIDLGAQEPPHGWFEGSAGSLHMHITTKAANTTGSNRYAKFTVWIAWANVGSEWVELDPFTAELTIPTGTAALHHFLLPMGAVNLPTGLIGLQAKARVKRIAATGGTEYSGDIFITQIGDHLLRDAIGSRDIATK